LNGFGLPFSAPWTTLTICQPVNAANCHRSISSRSAARPQIPISSISRGIESSSTVASVQP
jgi:hypothetical protein